MYYELYIDVLFLENFLMDYILLLITKHVLCSREPVWRICLAALAGALATCRSGRCQDTLYVYKIWTFLFDYSWNYADSGIEDPQRTGACKGNDYSVYRWIPDRGDIFLFSDSMHRLEVCSLHLR